MEVNGNRWNILETTVSYKARARLTPTLTHVVTYELVTSGAKGRAMTYPVTHEASPRVYFRPLDKGEGVGDPGESGVVRSELVVEEEMILDHVDEFFGSGSFSCEGEGGNS